MKNQTFCCIPNRNAVQNSTCLRCTAWFCCTTPYCNSLRACFFSFVPCYRRASQGSTFFYCSFSCRPAIRACVVRSLTTHGRWGRRRNSNMYFYAKKVFYDSGRVLWRAQLWGPLSCISQMVSVCCTNCVRHKSVLKHLWQPSLSISIMPNSWLLTVRQSNVGELTGDALNCAAAAVALTVDFTTASPCFLIMHVCAIFSLGRQNTLFLPPNLSHWYMATWTPVLKWNLHMICFFSAAVLGALGDLALSLPLSLPLPLPYHLHDHSSVEPGEKIHKHSFWKVNICTYICVYMCIYIAM